MSGTFDPSKAPIVETAQDDRSRVRAPGQPPMTEAQQNAPTEPPPAAAWPKTCSCGRHYTEHEWKLLLFIGRMVDDVESLDLRNCRECHTTLSQPTPQVLK